MHVYDVLCMTTKQADQFERIHDFARAFGALCWNLSKVIQRKDLPRIYTMCLPLSEQHRAHIAAVTGDTSNSSSSSSRGLSGGLQDLESTRDEVIAEVFKAPKRRIDNVITRLTDSVLQLQLHATVSTITLSFSLAHICRWSHFVMLIQSTCTLSE
jgi:hypothetical protein